MTTPLCKGLAPRTGTPADRRVKFGPLCVLCLRILCDSDVQRYCHDLQSTVDKFRTPVQPSMQRWYCKPICGTRCVPSASFYCTLLPLRNHAKLLTLANGRAHAHGGTSLQACNRRQKLTLKRYADFERKQIASSLLWTSVCTRLYSFGAHSKFKLQVSKSTETIVQPDRSILLRGVRICLQLPCSTVHVTASLAELEHCNVMRTLAAATRQPVHTVTFTEPLIKASARVQAPSMRSLLVVGQTNSVTSIFRTGLAWAVKFGGHMEYSAFGATQHSQAPPPASTRSYRSLRAPCRPAVAEREQRCELC